MQQNLLSISWNLYFSSCEPLVVGVSGGPDSMCLLTLLIHAWDDMWRSSENLDNQKKEDDFIVRKKDLQARTYIHVCCFDHATRKETSQEVKFVSSYASCYGCTFHTALYKGNNYTEKALRIRRHQQFIKIAHAVGAKKIFLGHTLTDRFETTLLNLSRGCNLAGFLGMKEIQPHFLDSSLMIVRPLLSFSKEEIQAYCDNHNIPYIIDPTNKQAEFSKRNIIRNNILPNILSLSNQFATGEYVFWRSINYVYEEIEKKILQLQGKIIQGKKELFLHPCWNASWGYEIVFSETLLQKKDFQDSFFLGEEKSMRGIEEFVVLLKDLGIYFDISQRVLHEMRNFFLYAKDGYKWRHGVYFFVCHGKRYIIKAPKNFWQRKEKDSDISSFFLQYGKNVLLKNGIFVSGFKVDSKQADNIIIRYPKQGDRFRGKKLSSWFINQKVPLFWRPCIIVVEKNQEIIDIFLPFVLACNQKESI